MNKIISKSLSSLPFQPFLPGKPHQCYVFVNLSDAKRKGAVVDLSVDMQASKLRVDGSQKKLLMVNGEAM